MSYFVVIKGLVNIGDVVKCHSYKMVVEVSNVRKYCSWSGY